MKRREFVSLMGVSSLAPLAIASCNSQTPQSNTPPSVVPPSATPPRSDGFQAVGTLTELNAKGQLSIEDKSLGKVLILPGPNSNGAIAINPTCTHAGCAVAWEQEQKVFLCPCHESKFDGSGKVLQGPADKPLATYTTQVEGDTILIKVG